MSCTSCVFKMEESCSESESSSGGEFSDDADEGIAEAFSESESSEFSADADEGIAEAFIDVDKEARERGTGSAVHEVGELEVDSDFTDTEAEEGVPGNKMKAKASTTQSGPGPAKPEPAEPGHGPGPEPAEPGPGPGPTKPGPAEQQNFGKYVYLRKQKKTLETS